MKDFPSCFGENGVQIADSSSGANRAGQNSVTCVYKSRLRGGSFLITIIWSKNLMGQGLSVSIDDSDKHPICKVDIKPSIFSKKKGSKSLDVDTSRVDIYWDLSSAKFGSGPEPVEGFYLEVLFDHEMALLLGDLKKEAYRKTNAKLCSYDVSFVSKRENLFGKRVFCTKSQFYDHGKVHDIVIECETSVPKDPCLSIRIDKKMVMQVKRLTWKFRGNQTVVVDGVPVEVSWDVHNWLFSTNVGSAVFMFQTCLTVEKMWLSNVDDPSVYPWSCGQIFREPHSQARGFSLILHAWKSE